MTEIRNPKPVYNPKIREFQTCFGHWILEFVIYLRFGAWSLGFHKPWYFKTAPNLYRQTHLTLTPARRDFRCWVNSKRLDCRVWSSRWQANTVTGWQVTNARTWRNHPQERKRSWGSRAPEIVPFCQSGFSTLLIYISVLLIPVDPQ